MSSLESVGDAKVRECAKEIRILVTGDGMLYSSVSREDLHN